MKHLNVWIAVVALACFWLPGCSKPSPTRESATGPAVSVSSLKDRNLVLIVIDSLRADHVGAYGYDRPTTPFIDSLAREGLVFERASANSSYITQSLSALFSGRLPTSGGTIGLLDAHPLDETPTLPQWFKQSGYYTGIVSNQPLIRGKGFTKGFEDLQIGSLESPWPGTEVSKRALDFVDDAADDPFMLYVHYLDPHQPYMPQQEFYDRFGDSPSQELLDLGAFRRDYVSAMAELDGANDPRVREAIQRYDAELASTDSDIEELVRGLEERGLLERTTLVITSNHGEEFLEHGYFGNTWTLYEETLHVPLIVYARGAIEAQRISSRVSLVDLAPTIVDLFGLTKGGAQFDGESLFSAAGKGFRFKKPGKPRIAELIIRERAIVRSIVVDDWKYIAASKWPEPEERYAVAVAYNETLKGILDGTLEEPPLWGAGAYEALYNLIDDPRERANVLAENTGRADALREALAEYQRYCETDGLTPRVASGALDAIDPADVEDLESLGYL